MNYTLPDGSIIEVTRPLHNSVLPGYELIREQNPSSARVATKRPSSSAGPTWWATTGRHPRGPLQLDRQVGPGPAQGPLPEHRVLGRLALVKGFGERMLNELRGG